MSSTYTGKFVFGGDFTCGPVTIHDLEVWHTYVTARSAIQGSGDSVSHSCANTFSQWWYGLSDPVFKTALSAYIPFFTTRN